MIPDLFNPFFMELIYYIERYVSQSGYSLLIANSDGNLERERAISNTLKARQVDGVLVGLVSQDSPLAEMLQNRQYHQSLSPKIFLFSIVSLSPMKGEGFLRLSICLKKITNGLFMWDPNFKIRNTKVSYPPFRESDPTREYHAT